ncbi:O-antigen ligase family protein [Candidatus Amesbacteria bacterium]|nr:O-antigen ligase family protein [Candidatus Amesbacteria bacterium]
MSFPARIIRWSFYALVLSVPLIFLPNTSELFEFPKMIVTYLLTTVIAAAWVSDCILQKRLIFRRSLLDIPLLLFLIFELLSLIFSINPHTSWFGYYSRFNGGLASLLCYSLLYWVFVTYMDKKSTLFVIRYSLFAAVLVSLWGIAEHFGADADKWVQDVQNRVFSTLGQPNWLAAYLVSLIFLPISHLNPNPKRTVLKGVSLIIMFTTLLFTRSRSGLLAFGISSAIFWSIYLFRTRSIKYPLILNSLFLILIFVTPNPISERFYHRPSPPSLAGKSAGPALESEVNITESGNIRKIVWTGAIRIWLDGPKNFLLGSGPETFAMTYYQHRPVEHNATSEWELLYNKAHNEFLNYLANTGLLGLLSYLVLLGFMAWTFITQISKIKNQSQDLSILISALFSGWLSLSVTNFWGFSVVITNIFLFLFPAIALTYHQQPPTYNPNPVSKSQIFLLFIPLFLILYSLFAISRYWLADVRYASGQYHTKAFTSTQNPSYLLSSYQAFQDAYRLNPGEPAISAEFSLISALMAASLPAEAGAEARRLTDLAISLSDKSISQNPFHPNYFKSRSRMFLILSTIDPQYYGAADAALAQAALISPTDPRIPYNRGLIAQYQNDSKKAAEFFVAANLLRPGLVK